MSGDPSDTASSLLDTTASTPTPEGSVLHPTDLLPRPTITLPALRAMAACAHASITAPTVNSSVDVVPPVVGSDPYPFPDGDPAPAVTHTPVVADAPAHPLALATQPSQTESDITEPGDSAGNTSGPTGPFDVDDFFANVADRPRATTVPVYPTAAPSSKKSLQRQSSKALDNAAAPTEKSSAKSKTDPPKFFHDSDMVLYNHIGLAPPVVGETAVPQCEHMIQNEVKLVAYVTSLERAASTARTDAAAHNAEFAKILADTHASLRNTDDGQNNGTDVAPLQLELARVRADLNASVADFAGRLAGLDSGDNARPDVLALKAEVAELRTDLLAANNQRILASPPFSVESDPSFQALARDVAALRSHIASSSSTPPFTLEKDNTLRGLYASLEGDRKRMDDIVNALPPPEFYDAFDTMRADITSLYSKAEDAERSRAAPLGPSRVHTSVVPSLFMSAPPGAPTSMGSLPTSTSTTARNMFLPATANLTAAPPLFHVAPTMARNLFGVAGGLDSAALAAPKRSVPTFGGPASKRPRLDGSQNTSPDVLFGPVTISSSTKPALKALASAAIAYFVQVAGNSGQYCALGEEDIASTQVDRSGPNTLSICFKSREKATIFCTLVEHYSPLLGQSAVFWGGLSAQPGRTATNSSSAGVANQQALYDLFGGGWECHSREVDTSRTPTSYTAWPNYHT
ncbi:hypothetical protein B0H14DRAFT_3870139 [Mycena olivaceomarginata]|nr:hypothetical protein B0H14DRAFT_3870139 [Mycena olivaceomarginata]